MPTRKGRSTLWSFLWRAHKLAPQNADVIFLLARVSMTQNYFEDAIPLLQSGLQLSPNRADLTRRARRKLFHVRQNEKAIEEFKALVALEPSARSYAFMGLSYRHLGRFDEARKYFQEGLKLDRHNSSCLFNMGYIEERQGNHAAAESFFQNALKSNPDYSEALLELANLRIASKKYEDAADLLRRYVKVSRDPASGYYKLAMVERNLHQSVAAQRDLNVFQTLSKNSSTGPYLTRISSTTWTSHHSEPRANAHNSTCRNSPSRFRSIPTSRKISTILTEAYFEATQGRGRSQQYREARPTQRQRLSHPDRHRRPACSLSLVR